MVDTVHQKVLVVDDSPLAREVVVQMLSNIDVEVITAESGEEAIERFEEQEFALILLDVNMGGISGFETASRIRLLDHSNNNVPIIFITASSTDTANIFEGYEAGAVDYLLKPVDRLTLCSKVTVFSRLHAQKDEIQQHLEEIQRKNNELETHLQEIEELRGLVPICASCKNIRDDTGYWHSIEQYFTKRSGTEFSHSICPGCRDKLYPELRAKV